MCAVGVVAVVVNYAAAAAVEADDDATTTTKSQADVVAYPTQSHDDLILFSFDDIVNRSYYHPRWGLEAATFPDDVDDVRVVVDRYVRRPLLLLLYDCCCHRRRRLWRRLRVAQFVDQQWRLSLNIGPRRGRPCRRRMNRCPLRLCCCSSWMM